MAKCYSIAEARVNLPTIAPSVDSQIAVIVFVNDLILVTLNVRDSARSKNLIVENRSKRGR